jgi:hypothetical protein
MEKVFAAPLARPRPLQNPQLEGLRKQNSPLQKVDGLRDAIFEDPIS